LFIIIFSFQFKPKETFNLKCPSNSIGRKDQSKLRWIFFAIFFFQIYNNLATGNDSCQCVVELFEKGANGIKVGEIPSCRGILKIKDPKPWWPYLMTTDEPGNNLIK
jgi:hypothetical protein